MKRFTFSKFKIYLLALCFSFISFPNMEVRALSISDNIGSGGGISIQFPLTLNTFMAENAYVFKGKNNVYYATLPLSLDSNLLTIEVDCAGCKTVKINDQLIDKEISVNEEGVEMAVNKAKVDISNTIKIEVLGESGRYVSYEVLAQKGIWQIDSLVYDFKEKYNIPGVSVAVANINQTSTAYKSGYGYAVLDSKKRVTSNHLFRLASMSKQHTAIGILKLVEEGKFGLDDFVFGADGILKDQFPTVPAKAGRITVRHLLEHTSGYSRSPDYIYNTAYSDWTIERRINAMLKARQPNEPGTTFAYYNTGYAILGYIIEIVSGKPYEKYLQDLYAQAGIDDIHVGGTQGERRENEVAYYSQNGSSSYGTDMDIRASSGGLIASTEQLFKLLWAIDGNPNIPDLLKKETVDQMFTASKVGESRYALGWRANHNFFPESFYHGGTLAGVATFWIYSKDYAAVVLCNSRSYRGQFDDDLYKMGARLIEEAKLLGL